MKPRIVIKLGGSALNDPKTLNELVLAIQGFRKKKNDVILVHGGGPAINQELTQRGITWTFINGQRQTTPEMMDVIEHVLATEVNSNIVRKLKDDGIPAVGLSGARHKIIFCSQASLELMCVGKVESVNARAVEEALALGQVPVVAPIGFGDQGAKFNVNADWAAAKIAVGLKAKKLVFLTDQSGILDANKKLVPVATTSLIQKMIETEVISGGMCTKVLAMMAALDSGIEQIRVLHAGLASRLHSRARIGTSLMESMVHEHAS